MSPKTIFKLHEPQHNVDPEQQKETYINMFFSYGYFESLPGKGNRKKYMPLKYSTGLQIKPVFWEDRPLYRVKKDLINDTEQYNKRLDFLQYSVMKVYHEFESNGLLPTPIQLKERFDSLVKHEIKKPVRNLNDYISNYITEAKNGKRLSSKNKRYRNLSIKNLMGFQVQFINYQKSKSKTLHYEHINSEFLSEFIQFFKEKKYSQNTIARHIKHLRMFMRSSREEGLHNNIEIDKQRFKVSQQEVKQVYLDESEIKKLLHLDLSKTPKLEIVRDVFLIGCYIAQRYSDYKDLKKKQIIQLNNQHKAIEIQQSISGKQIILPLRAEAVHLLEKYNYTLPYTYEQQINTKIQEIAKMAGISDQKEIFILKNGKRIRTRMPRYKLIKTHTARRSGCTNMYLANVPINEIMTISGHQTVFDFMKYLRASEIQIAIKLSAHPYFTNVV